MDYRKFCKSLIAECRKNRRIIRAMHRNGKPRTVYIEMRSGMHGSIELVVTDPTGSEKKLAKRIGKFLNFVFAVGKAKLAGNKGGDSAPPLQGEK